MSTTIGSSQRRLEEQARHKHTEPMANQSITSREPGGHPSGLLIILDIIDKTVQLASARRTYFLLLLPAFLLALLVQQGLDDYSFMEMMRSTPHSLETKNACEYNILRPWITAAFRKEISPSQQEEFYRLSELNCSMYKRPVESWGSYTFKNGSIRFKAFDGTFALAANPVMSHSTSVVLQLLCPVLTIWVLVAVAWGLEVASTTTPSYNNRPTSTALEKVSLTNLIQEQFSGKLLKGVLRVCLTKALAMALIQATSLFRETVLHLLLPLFTRDGIPLTVAPSLALWNLTTPGSSLAHPLRLLFLLSSAAAALEPGMWGLKALWRGIQLMRGNLWNSMWVHAMLSLWQSLCLYLGTSIGLTPTQLMNESFWGLSSRSMGVVSLSAAREVPGLFLLPVFYFFCKSWREKGGRVA